MEKSPDRKKAYHISGNNIQAYQLLLNRLSRILQDKLEYAEHSRINVATASVKEMPVEREGLGVVQPFDWDDVHKSATLASINSEAKSVGNIIVSESKYHENGRSVELGHNSGKRKKHLSKSQKNGWDLGEDRSASGGRRRDKKIKHPKEYGSGELTKQRSNLMESKSDGPSQDLSISRELGSEKDRSKSKRSGKDKKVKHRSTPKDDRNVELTLTEHGNDGSIQDLSFSGERRRDKKLPRKSKKRSRPKSRENVYETIIKQRSSSRERDGEKVIKHRSTSRGAKDHNLSKSKEEDTIKKLLEHPSKSPVSESRKFMDLGRKSPLKDEEKENFALFRDGVNRDGEAKQRQIVAQQSSLVPSIIAKETRHRLGAKNNLALPSKDLPSGSHEENNLSLKDTQNLDRNSNIHRLKHSGKLDRWLQFSTRSGKPMADKSQKSIDDKVPFLDQSLASEDVSQKDLRSYGSKSKTTAKNGNQLHRNSYQYSDKADIKKSWRSASSIINIGKSFFKHKPVPLP